MKRIPVFILPVLLLVACSESTEEQVIPIASTGKMTKEIIVNGTTREYIIYLPENYTGTTALPLLLSFHGLTSNMEFNYNYTNFDELAENNNFIVVYPNGISNRWIITANNNPDIDFIQALLNQLENDYNIESSRIYSTGMSNGGFFSFSLACSLSHKIAAVASVTGTMYRPAINNCFPKRPLSILQIHGTEDNIVDYSTVAGVIDFWTNHNNTDEIPISNDILDVDEEDGSIVQRLQYIQGDNDVEVQHLKVIGGGHEWPGYRGNMDINASEEVWNFVKAFDLNGKME